MAYSIDELASDCREVLSDEPGKSELEQVRKSVARALTDKDFIAEHLGPEANSPRNILYEDPDLGFCIIAHVYGGGANPPPHDHGPTWAVYGQVSGITEMTDFKVLKPPSGNSPGEVEPVRTYELHAGDTMVYFTGDVHTPRREDETRLIRVEGQDLSNIRRDRFELA
jgi:predicted metal-dependent enzyme (double-stranded beta helix superfamily)